jgi:hypothetical protein
MPTQARTWLVEFDVNAVFDFEDAIAHDDVSVVAASSLAT